MNKIISKINNSKHIVVVANGCVDSICSASAFYTYLLTLHKKVSFCSSNQLESRLSFIPWSQKVKNNFPSSADFAIVFGNVDNKINIECESIKIDMINNNSISKIVYDLFKDNSINLNHKMATSLYSGILDSTNGFLDDNVDGTIFAMAKELVELGIDTKICNKYIIKYMSLASFRLKSMMLNDMKLVLGARVALFVVKDDDLLSFGATEKDCENIISEALFLPTVDVAILLREHNDFSIKALLKSHGSLDLMKIVSQFNGVGNHRVVKFDFLNENQIKEKKLELLYKEIEIESKK